MWFMFVGLWEAGSKSNARVKFFFRYPQPQYMHKCRVEWELRFPFRLCGCTNLPLVIDSLLNAVLHVCT